MGSAPADDRAAGDRLPVGRLDGVPVRERDEPSAAGRARRGQRFQLRVGRARQLGPAEGPPEPRGQVVARGLQDLQDVRVRDAAREGAVNLTELVLGGRDAGVHGGAHVQVGDVRGDRRGADAGRLAVAAAGDDRDLGDPPFLGELGLERAEGLPGLDEAGHLIAAHARDLKQALVVVELGDVEEAQGIGAGGRIDPRAGQTEGDVGRDRGDLLGARPQVGLVLLDPRHLVDGRGDVRGLAGELVDLGRAVPEDLVGGADVEPQDAVAQRRAVGGERREGLALVRDAEGRDALLLRRGQLAHGLPHGLVGGGPPLARVVLAEPLLR